MADDAEYWSARALTLQREQLETVQKAATAWSALFAAVLGIFGSVTFAGGLTTIDKLDEPLQGMAKGATLLAALLALIATVLAGIAASPFPRATDQTSWQHLEKASQAAAERAFSLLTAGLRCGVAAAGVVLLGSAVVLIAGEASPDLKAPTLLVVSNDGAAVCGKLTVANEQLTVGGRPLKGVASVTVVTACPV